MYVQCTFTYINNYIVQNLGNYKWQSRRVGEAMTSLSNAIFSWLWHTIKFNNEAVEGATSFSDLQSILHWVLVKTLLVKFATELELKKIILFISLAAISMYVV